MPREDSDAAEEVQKRFIAEGVDLRLGYETVRFEKQAEAYQLICRKDGQEQKIEFDALLLAVGRRANTSGFGLENLGIKINDNGTINVNEHLQTSLPNIYACGDVAGPYQFTHTAAHQAWYAAVNGLFGVLRKFKVDCRVIPWSTFTDPEMARIAEYVQAMKYGIGINKILGTIHIYPTLTESNKYVAGEWKRAHVSATTLTMVEKFHRWRRS